MTTESVMATVLPRTIMACLRTATVLPKIPMAFLKTIIVHLKKAIDHLMIPTITAMDVLKISITTVLVARAIILKEMCTNLSLSPMATEHL